MTAWPELRALLDTAAVDVDVLEVDVRRGRRAMAALGVSEHSFLGALAGHTGGLVLDHGWVRILGGGHPPLDDLATANGIRIGDPLPARLVVGHDVLGGRFAVQDDEVGYWSPDSLAWESMEVELGEFLGAFLAGAGDGFYADLRWEGWHDEVSALGLDQGLLLHPFLSTSADRDLGAAHRQPIDMKDLVVVLEELAGG